MSDLWSNASITNPFNDPQVDQIGDNQGVVESLPSLSFDMPDNAIVNNLNQRINDSKAYFDKQDGHNLTNSRNEAMRGYLGRTIDVNRLYRYMTPYNENQIYIAVESIVAYATAQNPQPEVYPAQNNPTSKIFAQDLEKYLMAHSEHFQLANLLQSCVRNVLAKKVAFIELEFDPDYGEDGEIIPRVLNPEHCVVDKHAKMGEVPQFFCVMTVMNVNQIIERWPEKVKEIRETLGIERRGTKNMEQELIVRKVWVINYDKDYKPELGCVYYFGDLVLEKIKNPNWLYSTNKNFLPNPRIPIIPLNFDNTGEHWIDETTPIEQTLPLQHMLNKRGKQMMEIADKANGILVVSTDSGLTKDDLQNLTGDPNQRLLIKTLGQRTADMVFQVPPPIIPPFLMTDKVDLRTQIGNMMGAPTDFTGADSSEGATNEQTLGQSLLNKNQASGRQDLLVRAIDRFMSDYFNFLTQMMVVWYTSKHMRVYNGGDGEFDYIVMSRELIDDGISVSVKSGTTLPFDKQRQEAVALQMAKMGLLSPLDVYKMLHMTNPQQLYDNWAKFKTNPQELSRTVNDESDDSKAFIAFKEIMNGKEAEEPKEATKEFVLSLRKKMLTDEFFDAPKKYQKKLLDYIEKALDSLELRTSLDEMSQQSDQLLDPSVPIQPYQPPQPPMPAMMGGAPGLPSALPPQQGGTLSQPGAGLPPSPLQGLPTPGMQAPPGQPMPGSPMNGTPMVNPNNPQMPPAGNVTSLPTL